jgi:hypothetical protein
MRLAPGLALIFVHGVMGGPEPAIDAKTREAADMTNIKT